jgi:hypothetical protein
LANDLPFTRLVFFNRCQQCGALVERKERSVNNPLEQTLETRILKGKKKEKKKKRSSIVPISRLPRLQQIRRSACPAMDQYRSLFSPSLAGFNGIPCTNASSHSPPFSLEMSIFRLLSAPDEEGGGHRNLRAIERTFAISLHDEPASRMVFNLCSSAGDHGVFVLDFFAGGDDKLTPSVCVGVTVAFVVALVAAVVVVVVVVVVGGPEARRFLPLVGEGGTAKPPVGLTSVMGASTDTGGWIWSACAADEASKGSRAGFMFRLVIGAVEL